MSILAATVRSKLVAMVCDGYDDYDYQHMVGSTRAVCLSDRCLILLP